ncbi:MAG: HAD family hydrolase [Stackebrandtia sp.]
MTPKLVATDLDGTLVRSDETVSARSHETLKRLAGRGVTVVGVTGRGPRLRELCRVDVPSADYLVLAQGGFIYEYGPGGAVVEHRATLMPGSQVSEVVKLVERETGPLSVFVEADPGHESQLLGDVSPEWPYPIPITPCERDEALDNELVKAYLSSDKIPALELLELARRIAPPQWCGFTESGIGFVEVCPPGVDKGTGLAQVASQLGVEPRDVLVFGDALNDLPMFAWAGRSVAMAGAHPSVKAAADEITVANDEDGVAIYLERVFGELAS